MSDITRDVRERRAMRCPRLGGEVFFSYCECEAGDLPCARILVCWQAVFPVEEYLRSKLTGEEWMRFCIREPKDKMTTLLELVEQAKKRTARTP